MAIRRKELASLIEYESTKINIQLLKCFKKKQKEIIIKDIYYAFNNMPYVKETMKYPGKRFLYNHTIKKFNNSLLELLNDLNEYDKQTIYNFITIYYNWIIPILSDKGIVEFKEVEDEINMLIHKYNLKSKNNKYLQLAITEIVNNKEIYNPLFIRKQKDISKDTIIDLLVKNKINRKKILYINNTDLRNENLKLYDYLIMDNIESVSLENQNKIHRIIFDIDDEIQIIALLSIDINNIDIKLKNLFNWGLII